jgi:branched-chain amino acid transport system ATP-binding protein
MLEVKNLHVSYGAIKALHGVSLSVKQGSIVTLIGSNGAGKSTTLRAISGLVKPRSGEILFEGKVVSGLAAHQIVALGLSHVPEGRMVFANLTVYENLMMGAYLQRDKAVIARELELVFKTFPRLQEREKQIAGTLSGGEQQMLAIGRALMSKPKFLMMDEPSQPHARHHHPARGAERESRTGDFPLRLRARDREDYFAERVLSVAPRPESAQRVSGWINTQPNRIRQ